MKLKFSLFLALALVCGSTALAQTNTQTTLLGDFKQLGSDALNTLKGQDFNDGIDIEAFGIYHNGDFGGGLAVSTAHTNSPLNMGFAIAAMQNATSKKADFYDASLSLQLGEQVTIPVLKVPVYLYIESGPALNLHNPSAVLEQSIAGAKYIHRFSNGMVFSAGGGVGHNSEWPDSPFYIAHVGLTF